MFKEKILFYEVILRSILYNFAKDRYFLSSIVWKKSLVFRHHNILKNFKDFENTFYLRVHEF